MTNVHVRTFQEADIPSLQPILVERVRDSETNQPVLDEIDAIIGYMRGATDEYGRVRTFSVATATDAMRERIIGCMAFGKPDPFMMQHFNLPDDGMNDELLNAFVTNTNPVKGTGSALFNHIRTTRQQAGMHSLVVHSGPRYERSGWGFWDRMMGERQGFIQDRYGKGRHAMTWRKFLCDVDESKTVD